jgi:hypothetical protein
MTQAEYPFWARWARRIDGVITPITDITSVSYQVKGYNDVTNVFDNISGASGTISAADANGRWIAPYSIPSVLGYKRYECVFTPVGGSHQVLIDQLDTTDGSIGGNSENAGAGTESHSGIVTDPSGNPLSGAIVVATPYGTQFEFATTTTNALGEYTINGLYVNHAYTISFNKDGYWGKNSEVVIA